jgi:hypothetical protein
MISKKIFLLLLSFCARSILSQDYTETLPQELLNRIEIYKNIPLSNGVETVIEEKNTLNEEGVVTNVEQVILENLITSNRPIYVYDLRDPKNPVFVDFLENNYHSNGSKRLQQGLCEKNAHFMQLGDPAKVQEFIAVVVVGKADPEKLRLAIALRELWAKQK